MSLEAEGASPPHVTTHPFTPAPGQPWARCVICRLAEPAHRGPGVYRPDVPYRCADCVGDGTRPCPHQERRRA